MNRRGRGEEGTGKEGGRELATGTGRDLRKKRSSEKGTLASENNERGGQLGE